MINWKTTKEYSPEPGDHVVLLLPNGAVCSGKVTNTMGIELEYVDHMDILIAKLDGKLKWAKLDE